MITESRPTMTYPQDDIPIGVSALDSADSEPESADPSADSNADSAKVNVWVWPFSNEINVK